MILLKRLAVVAAAVGAVGLVGVPVTEGSARADGATSAPSVSDAPAPQHALTDEEEAEAAAADKVDLGIGARVRFMTIPQGEFELFFVGHAMPLTAVGYSGQFIRRKGNLDIEKAVEYEKLVPQSGWWLDNGNNPGLAGESPDYRTFDISAVGVSATFVWHAQLSKIFQFRYGVGFGALAGFGSMKKTPVVGHTCDTATTTADLNTSDTTAGGHCVLDTSMTSDQSYPPVLPLVNLVTGIRVKVADQLSFDVEIGVEDFLLFTGIGFGYFF